MSAERPGRGQPVSLSLLFPAVLLLAGCATGSAPPVVLAVALPAAVDTVLAAAPGCGMKPLDARRDEEGRSALVVLLDGWQDPRPESAVVTVRIAEAPGGVSATIEGRPLAELGMAAPDIRAGSEGLACVPCAATRAEIPTVRYSRGLAAGNVTRATRCLRSALGGEPPGP